MRELGPKTPRRAPFQNLNEFRHRHLWWQLDEQMHMIGHRLDLNHHSAKFGDHLCDDLLQPRLEWTTQHISAVFRAPFHPLEMASTTSGVSIRGNVMDP